MEEIIKISKAVTKTISEYYPKLIKYDEAVITLKPEGWCIKEILGHLIDSATNNLHRVVHLQYQPLPLVFPNYGSDGNNSKWIKIQKYMGEDWQDMVALWKYTNLHLAHVIENIDSEKLDNLWIAGPGREITLREMIEDYPQHMNNHLKKIEELASK